MIPIKNAIKLGEANTTISPSLDNKKQKIAISNQPIPISSFRIEFIVTPICVP